jgi:DNA invertase Pin-like site-specific DNA recombinase
LNTRESLSQAHAPGGKLVFHIFAALAKFQRNKIRERTRAGLEAVGARVWKGDRQHTLDDKKSALPLALYRGKKHTVDAIRQPVGGISRTTFCRFMR